MADYYFDTSGLVKRHVNETGSGWVRSLTQAKAGHTLYIARITAVEMVAAVTRRQRGGSLSAAQGGAIVGRFRRHLSGRYFILELTPALASSAMQLSRSHGLRAYDAVQLATAMQLDRGNQAGGFGPVPLVSADADLNTAALAEGLLVENPNLHP